MTDEKLPFTQHLEELRQRLIKCFIAIGIFFAISYNFADKIFRILVDPLIDVLPKGQTLIFTGLSEGFFTYLRLSLICGIFFAFPIILYQIWSFISPGLYKHEKRYALPFVILSTIFFIGGALFGYFIVFPIGFKFFIQTFTTDIIKPMPSIKQFLSFATLFLFVFGIVFEMPLFMFFLERIGVVNYEMLKRNRKYSIIIIFIVAAILSPPDVVSQLLMGVPLLILYEISILVIRIFGRKKKIVAA